MSLSVEDVRWVAHLARLEVTPEEAAEFARELSAIVAYVDQLQRVDTEGVEPLAHPFELRNVFRADEPSPSLTVDRALANAPQRKGDFFAVPAVLD